MSVVVIGMDMPTNCLQCSFVRIVSDHYYCGCNANCMLGEYVGEYLEGVRRHEGCPLVELPSGHGRLIDGNELQSSFRASIDECKKWIKELEETGDNDTLVLANQAFCTFVEAALRLKSIPTIVEAEG